MSKSSQVGQWEAWQPANEGEEAQFCDLVCSDCTKSLKNEGDYPMGCKVLFDAINNGGTDILFSKTKGKIRCTKQALKGQPIQYRCKNTPDLFGAST